MQAASAFISKNLMDERNQKFEDWVMLEILHKIDGITGIAKGKCFPMESQQKINQNQIYAAQRHPSFVPTPIPSCPEHVILASPVKRCNPKIRSHFYG